MVDVVGIIAAGRLVREGHIESLLLGQGIVRARVSPAQVPAATRAIAALVAPDAIVPSADEPGWLAVHIEPERASDVTRVLAEAGIYLSAMEAGSDLESLFLELTGGSDQAGVIPTNGAPPTTGGPATTAGAPR